MMRRFILIVGVGSVLAGAAVAIGQAIQWHRDGVWREIPFSVLWVALGEGDQPDLSSLGRVVATPLAWLLRQPLSLVLFGIGACLAWFGGTGVSRRYSRF